MTWVGHGRITIALVVPTAVVTDYTTQAWQMGLMAALGVLCGLVIDPDLDLTVRTGSRWRVSALSPELGMLWGWYWWPYGRIIPHRSVFSHLPVLGTILRVIYLFLPLGLVMWGLGVDTAVIADAVYNPFLWAWVVGLMVSDAGHWVADRCPIRL